MSHLSILSATELMLWQDSEVRNKLLSSGFRAGPDCACLVPPSGVTTLIVRFCLSLVIDSNNTCY